MLETRNRSHLFAFFDCIFKSKQDLKIKIVSFYSNATDTMRKIHGCDRKSSRLNGAKGHSWDVFVQIAK